MTITIPPLHISRSTTLTFATEIVWLSCLTDANTLAEWAAAIVRIPSSSGSAPLHNVETSRNRGSQILFTIDQLRLLQDAVARDRAVLSSVGSALPIVIATELQRKGVPAVKAAAGAAFGTLETTISERIDGDETTGTWYSYKINIRFTPDTAVVHADEIAFIQTVRLVETTNGVNKNPDEKSKKRQTPSATNVDRRNGKKQGWYGMKDDGTSGTMLTTWQKSTPATPATMQDRASWNEPNTTWQFETMVVCRAGTNIGKVYAAVTWGFSVGADLTLTERAPTVTNKQSAEATRAVRKWNDQATGSPFDRNAQDQIPLPELR